ncbi:MAG: hypothetical protein Q4C66_14365 [Lachnospiraceae bacterium]|nr:hypothetical protein [Lachnospiraceae bacterium]
MKRKNRRNRMSAFLAAMILTILCFCQAAFAAEDTEGEAGAGLDPARLVTLTIDLEAQDHRATIFLYRVGEWDGSAGAYVLTNEFAGSGADLTDRTAAGMQKASQILEKYAREYERTAVGAQATTGGIARFTELSHGLYLICQVRGRTDNVTITPFLTTLPVLDEVTHTWDYDVKAFTKHEPDQPDPTDPDEPTKPDPTDPDEPTKPDPTKPTNPDEPTKPNPTSPDHPGSDKPDKPDRPTPDKPTPTGPNPTDPAPEQPTPGGGRNTPGTPEELHELVDSLIPRSGLERMLDQIEDMLTPLGVLPRTGDGSISYGSLLLILAVSGTLIVCLIQRRRKRERKDRTK